MKHNILAPSVGESITEVSILKWRKKDGDFVKNGETILEIESDKATVEIVAESSGSLHILKGEGERIPVGETIGAIDDQATKPPFTQPSSSQAKTHTPSSGSLPPSTSILSSSRNEMSSMGPAARKMATEQGIATHQLSGTGKDGRITKGDLLEYSSHPSTLTSVQSASPSLGTFSQTIEKVNDQGRSAHRRVPMSALRSKIAERLVQVQHEAAILTTFNEVDMSSVLEVRKKNKDAFKEKYGVSLGFMSFFTKACIKSLQIIPSVNASIYGKDILYHDYFDIGIAVGTERGLVVPVLRNADQMSFAEIEKKISELALKAREGKLSIPEMSGGTFTITNGGVYGSLLSTPILNPPQSGILGMHKIQERPMAIEGKIEIRPMMYVALSYDHRLIDGKEAVTFLVNVKDFLEHPEKLGMEF